jgi:hypothetical protein
LFGHQYARATPRKVKAGTGRGLTLSPLADIMPFLSITCLRRISYGT